jgi:hypothetical protein
VLAQQAWQDAKALNEAGMTRLAERMEKRNENANQ